MTARGRTDSASRVVPAPAERLYAAFADGETLMRWLPPPNMTGRALVYDFKVGGEYRIELRFRQQEAGAGKTTGDSDISKGRFVELVPARTIKQTVQFESDDPELARGMAMTWRFAERGDCTEVSVTAEDVPAAISKADHLQGLNASLDNLARFVATVAPKASAPNPKLASLAFLVGEWRTEGTHPMRPGKALPGRTSFRWIEGGAFLTMRQEVDDPDFPDGLAIVGSDDSAGSFGMLYFDERGTSRRMEVEVGERAITWRHEDEKFAQKLSLKADGDDRLVSKGLMSENGGPWKDDLSQVFTRA